MITKRDFILRVSCFCEMYNASKYWVFIYESHITNDALICISSFANLNKLMRIVAENGIRYFRD